VTTLDPVPADNDKPEAATPRLHVVTGKGGVGKTTVAAALAMALCEGGRRVLLCEVEGRSGIARLFDADTLPYAETRVARPGRRTAGELYALPIGPGAALEEYLADYLHLGAATRALDKVGALDFVTTVAPGLRDVVLGGKVYEATRRRSSGTRSSRQAGRPPAYAYDAVVLDAPPTGRIARFLGASGEVAELARKGPIHTQAESIVAMLTSSTTVAHMVTLAEEMPVQEAMDGVAELRAAGIAVGSVIVNARRPAWLAADTELGASAMPGLVQALAVGGLPERQVEVIAEGLLVEGRQHLERLRLEQRLVGDLAGAGVPVWELPWLAEGIDSGSLQVLAGRIATYLPGLGVTAGAA
jgi:anion-transporting  ArsA/GET3 family ATPase